ncbi:DUF3667 domain-containing protein [Marinifilum caeruleilacunae]|nr:DUF3667 domain-containing protein [Marinifilum caeruleilacunae]
MKYSIQKYLNRLPKRKITHFEGFCANCSHPVSGKYCSNCGQSVKELQRPFFTILSDSLGDALSLDNKFFHTLLPMIVKPGFLTKEFMQGRRARYTPPFRFYLFLTFFAFLLLSYNHKPEGDIDNAVLMETEDGEQLNIISFLEGISDGADEQDEDEIDEQLSKVDSIMADSVGKIKLKKGIFKLDVDKKAAEIDSISVNDSIPDKKSEEDQTSMINDNDIRKLIEMWKLNPALMLDNVFKKLSQTLLFILPIFALLLALFYVRQKRYLIEHLLISLNFHSFIFVMVILSELLILTHLEFLQPLTLYLYLLIPVQLFLTLKFYYKQGWLKTTIKFFVLSFFYNILLFTGVLYSLISLID